MEKLIMLLLLSLHSYAVQPIPALEPSSQILNNRINEQAKFLLRIEKSYGTNSKKYQQVLNGLKVLINLKTQKKNEKIGNR